MTHHLRPIKSEPHATGQSGGVLGQNTCGIAAHFIVAQETGVGNTSRALGGMNPMGGRRND